MKTLKEDWATLQDCDPNAHGVNPLEIKGINMELKALDNDMFVFRIVMPGGYGYSEYITDYGDLYDALGHIFAEQDGILDNLLCKGQWL